MENMQHSEITEKRLEAIQVAPPASSIVPKPARPKGIGGCEGLGGKAKCEIDKMGGAKCTMKTGSGNKRNVKYLNNHPTVKPLALMKYLCTITKTPTGGIVLDPFCGSGTTLMACKELKRNYIGIDNTEEYCEIARRRVNATPEPLF
ncbi:hypothetical protein ES708_28712 [subsurface metagenome]